MTQQEAMNEIFGDPDNRLKVDAYSDMWYQWKRRYIKGTLSDKLQKNILTQLGYKIIKEREWK